MHPKSCDALRERWEKRAQANPMFYINAERQDWTPAEFLAGGDADVARFVDPMLPLLPRSARESRALDIGCGLGRLTRALATRFQSVDGIDISPVMVEQAKSFSPPVPENVRYHLCDGSGAIPLPDRSIDFVFSFIVLQHVPTAAIVKTYLREIARVLSPGGLALLQLNTHRRSFRERFRFGILASDKMPILKHKFKCKLDPHSSLGVVFKAARCHQLARGAGLQLEKLTGAGTQYTWLQMRCPG